MEFLIGIIFLLLSYAFLSHWQRNKLPPSPGIAIPILGHLHLLGNSPHRSLFELSQKYGDFMYLKLGSVNTIVVSSATMAKEVLKTHDRIFACRPTLIQATGFAYQPNDLVFAPYGEHWKNLRKICNLELFTTKQIQSFSEMRRTETLQFLSDIALKAEKGEKVELISKLSDLTLNFMMQMCFSKSFSCAKNEQEKERALLFKKQFMEAFYEAGCVYIGDVLPYLKFLNRSSIKKLDVIRANIDEFLDREVEEHEENWKKRGNRSIDFMDILLSSAQDRSLTRLNIKGVAFDMLSAGSDSVSVLMEWALSELMRNPSLLEKAQKEIEQVTGRQRHLEEEDIPKLSYLQAIIKETFRLHPPTPLMVPHESSEECKVLDYVIPAKTRLFVNAYAIGRDPTIWNEPLKFDPDRFLNTSIDVRGQHYELLPFGSGRRICPGAQLAIIEAQYVLGSLLNVFDWQLPHGLRPEDIDISEGYGAVIPRAHPLKLVPRVNKSFADKLY